MKIPHWKIYLVLLVLYSIPGFSMTPQEGLDRLIKGNKRYINNKLKHSNRGRERRKASSSNQYPYAIVVGCSDSRVAPEIVFDEGIGDLFVVRVAGNVIGQIELNSIDYSAIHLKSAVILVMGHANCGAVDAVLHDDTKDIRAVAKLIKPAVKEAVRLDPKNALENAIKINAQRMRALLLKTPAIKKLVKAKKLEVHAAYYDLESGIVELLKN